MEWESIDPGVTRKYTSHPSVHICDLFISVHLPLPSPSPISRYLHIPAIAHSTAKPSGSSGEKRIFQPQYIGRRIDRVFAVFQSSCASCWGIAQAFLKQMFLWEVQMFIKHAAPGGPVDAN